MTVYNSDPMPSAAAPKSTTGDDRPEAAGKQEPTFQSGTAQPASQAERSVLHPEWHDPEWRYYHGAWGG